MPPRQPPLPPTRLRAPPTPAQDDRPADPGPVPLPPAPPADNAARPLLPRRRKQEHLVPELRGDPILPSAARRSGPEPEHDPGLMAAFRRGVSLADETYDIRKHRTARASTSAALAATTCSTTVTETPRWPAHEETTTTMVSDVRTQAQAQLPGSQHTDLSWLLTGLVQRVPHARSALLLSSDGLVKAAHGFDHGQRRPHGRPLLRPLLPRPQRRSALRGGR